MSKTLTNALIQVQAELKAPKNQRNNFGKYNYRSAEDILEAVKPLLTKNSLSMTILMRLWKWAASHSLTLLSL